jgi:hypothetical protein
MAYPAVLCLVVLAILYPFSALMHMPKWDSMNGFLPYRYFISFYLENDQPPFWNPFQRLGYPGYADLQSGCWYPVTRLIMLFGQYDVTSLIAELLSCYLIAALGMYRLSLHLHGCPKTAFLLGLVYSLSGFMTGSAHLMVFLIGVAWFPWIIWALLKYFEKYERRYAVYASAFIAMNITGASPAYTIILAYVISGMLIHHVIRHVYSWRAFLDLIRGAAPAALLLILLLAPYVISFLDFAPYFNRLGKRPYEEMILNPLSAGNYLSLVFPYAVNDARSDWFKPTDLSLRNIYMGLVVLAAVISALLSYRHKTKLYIPLVLCTFIACWLAFGDLTFLYKWVYHLPGFGLFRHPSFFRSYALFCMILLAGFRLSDFFRYNEFSVFDKIAAVLISGFVLVMTACAALFSEQGSLRVLLREILEKAEIVSTGVWTMILLNAVIIISLISLVWLVKRYMRIPWFTALAIFTVLELASFVRLTGPTTMYYTFPYKGMKTYFRALPDQIVQPGLDTPMKHYDDKNGVKGTEGIWVNVSTFNKALSWEGENPLRFAAFEQCWKNGTLGVNLENPLFFLPTRLAGNDTVRDSGQLWNAPEIHTFFPDQVRVEKFLVDFNRFSATVSNASVEPHWLVLNQNYHHHWKATMDGRELPVYLVNDMLMGVLVPPQTQGEVQFRYESPLVMPAWYLALAAWSGILAAVVYRQLRRKWSVVH